MNKYRVKVTGIDYNLDYEYVANIVEQDNPDMICGTDHFNELVNEKTMELEEELPQEMIFEFGLDEEDECQLEHYLAEMVSDETGWYIRGYDEFEILEKTIY